MTDEEKKAAEEAAKQTPQVETPPAEKKEDPAPAPKQEEKPDNSADLEKIKADLAAAQEELERARAEAKKFEGIDPVKAREDAKKLEEAERKAREAEVERAKAEGNFERLRELQQEEIDAQIAALKAERDEALAKLQRAEVESKAAQISRAFSDAAFITQETVLSPSKAQKLFGDHVAFEDGKVVVYDAPEGAAKRAIIMDTRGNPLPFNEAIQKVILADPEKDTLIKAKVKPGAESKTIDAARSEPEKSRLERLASGLAALKR